MRSPVTSLTASLEVKELEDEKQRGHELQAERAAVENINRRVKEWAVADEVWDGIRQPELFFDRVMRVVCALANVIVRSHVVRELGSLARTVLATRDEECGRQS